jgi:hypothetical protein
VEKRYCLHVYLIPTDEESPFLLSCPRSSLRSDGKLLKFFKFAKRAVFKEMRSKAYQLTVARFTLRKQTYPGGRSASIVEPEIVRILDPIEEEVRCDLLMGWTQELQENWQASLSVSASPKENEIVDSDTDNTDIEDESDDEDSLFDGDDVESDTGDSECVGTGKPNSDWVGSNPPSPSDDLPF